MDERHCKKRRLSGGQEQGSRTTSRPTPDSIGGASHQHLAQPDYEHHQSDAASAVDRTVNENGNTNGARSYRGTVADGHAVVHQGDYHGVTNHFYHQNQLAKEPDTVKVELMKSLTFARMDARLHNVATAFPKTCAWLFRHRNFLSWNDESKVHEHNGFLWIKGKPGCGKSTIMKSAWAWAKRRWSGEWTIVNYFFNARAPGSLEKSSLGLYRSLAHQLLLALPQFTNTFTGIFSFKVREGVVEDWTEHELQNFLVDVVKSTNRPTLCLFIDALDEGDEDDVRTMVEFLEELATHADEHVPPLRICLSSRHYPHISILKGLDLVVEDQKAHDADIELFVQNRLLGSDDERTHELRTKICQKSAGIFLWVVLVVPMLNKIHDQGLGFDAMQRRLDQVPPGLKGLFADILARDMEEMHNCVTLLQWVLFSTRPLTSKELYCAVQQHSHPNLSTPDEGLLSKFLLNFSRGLVEVTKASPPVVQFIHETVREFLIGSDGLGGVDSALLGNVPGRSHDKLRQICSGCLRRTVAAMNARSSLAPYEILPDLDPNVQTEIETASPFLAYAIDSIFLHAEAAQAANISQNMFLNDLTSDTDHLFRRWKQLRDGHQKFKVRRYKHGETLLYVLVDLQCRHLVTEVISGWPKMIRHTCGRYGNALQAASFYGDEAVVQHLVDSDADVNAKSGEYGHAVVAALYGKHLSVAELLMEHGASLTIKRLNEVLVTMVARGWLPGVGFLLDYGADANAKNRRRQPVLFTAIARRDSIMANLLLQHGSATFYSSRENSIPYPALQFASYKGLDTVVRVLLDKGEDPNLDGHSALQLAAAQGHLSIVEYLHANGDDINARDKNRSVALLEACWYGHLSVAKYLLANGADSISRATALWMACFYSSIEIVKLLLDHGAETNRPGMIGGSALHAALTSWSYHYAGKSVIPLLKMLLEANPDVHETPCDHETLCMLAVSYDRPEKVLEFLLERGADVNAKNIKGLCALVEASRRGRVEHAKVLIDAGAGYDISHGVDHDVWNQAIAEAHKICNSESKSLMLQALRSGLQQAEERWADQQRENFSKSCTGQS